MFEEKDEAFIIQEDLSIGVKEGLPEYMFSLLRDIDVDEDGNIYALDFRETKVKVFDSHGVYIRTIGQRGQGPGEFVSAYVLSVTPQKHLFVTDVAGRRISIFELSCEFIRAISTAETLVLFPTLDSKDGNGKLNSQGHGKQKSHGRGKQKSHASGEWISHLWATPVRLEKTLQERE